jgi:hypothetical protein
MHASVTVVVADGNGAKTVATVSLQVRPRPLTLPTTLPFILPDREV